MSSNQKILTGLYKRASDGVLLLHKFSTDAIVDPSGNTLTSHVNNKSVHMTTSDIDNLVVQKIHTAMCRVLDGGDGSTLLNKHATLELISRDLSSLRDIVMSFLEGTDNGGIVDRLAEIINLLDIHQNNINNLMILSNTVTENSNQLAACIDTVNVITSNMTIIQSQINDLLPLVTQYESLTNTLMSIQINLTSIDERVDNLELTIGQLTNELNQLSANLTTYSNTLSSISSRMDTFDSSITTLSDKVNQLVEVSSPSAIGVCLHTTGNVAGNFRHIDINGNFINGFQYFTHPLYTDTMRDVVISDCHMREIDTIYVKTANTGISGSDSNGKKCWWLSTVPLEGFRPVLAFRRDGIVKPHIYIGKYLGLDSIPDTTPTTNMSKADLSTQIANKNTNGVTGFRMMDVYDLSLLRLMLLVFSASGDCTTFWGDNISNVVQPATGETGASAFGVDDLWRCYSYPVDKIYSNASRKMVLTDPSTNEYITTDLTIPYTTTLNWIVDVANGDLPLNDITHDMLELFIPKTLSTSRTNGTFNDGTRYTASTATNCDMYIGGAPYSSTKDYISLNLISDSTRLVSGIFMTIMERYTTYGSYYSSVRIAKS